MVKYFDLLRAHQQKEAEETEASPNPKSLEAHQDDHAFEELLSNEKPIQQKNITTQALNNGKSLLVDEKPSKKEKSLGANWPTTIDASTTIDLKKPDNTWLKRCVHLVFLLFQYAHQNKATDVSPLSKHISNLLAQLKHDKSNEMMDILELSIVQQARQIQRMNKNLGSLVQKSILMMLYAIKVGQHLKLNDHELHTHTTAAMLHHIGMTQVSANIRQKKERLNKKELAEINQAFQYGHDFLLQCKVSNKSILQATLQAPERYDGSGKTGLKGNHIAWGARLVSVLSMFEALIHYRPYRARLLPRDAIREIVKYHKKSFDIVMLKALIESISLYPIGTYVQLNSGEIGMVVHIHPHLPLRPVVNIQMDLHGRDIPLRQVDLRGQPNLSIEKCMYKENIHNLKSQ